MNIWLLRPCAGDKDYSGDFIKDNIVGIGWGATGNLTGKNKEDIKKIVAHKYSLSGVPLGSAYGIINTFVNNFQIGDMLLIPIQEKIYFAKVAGDYTYNSSQIDYPHQRNVEWFNNANPISRTTLPKELRSSLKVAKTIAKLSHHLDTIVALATGKNIPITTKEENFIEVEYPIRTNVKAKICIPKDITQLEASRFSDFVKTLYFN